MRELQLFLDRREKDRASVTLIPVFFRLSYSECDKIRGLYAAEGMWEGKAKPDAGQLEAWAKAVDALLEFTGAKPETVRGLEAQQSAAPGGPLQCP